MRWLIRFLRWLTAPRIPEPDYVTEETLKYYRRK